MKKTTILIMIIAAMFLITGCQTENNEDTTLFAPFNGGTEGISINFQQGLPPDEIYDNGKFPFSVGIALENMGEYNFEASKDYGKLELQGFNPEYFGNPETEKTLDFDLKGKKKNFEGTVLNGGKEYVTFEDYNYNLDIQGNDQLKIRAKLCYDYQTKTHTKICIKENTFEDSQEEKELCTVNEIKDPKNSGAPVHVSALSELPMGQNKIQVLFTISHVGTGNIYKLGTVCDDSVTNTDKNKVYATVNLPEGTDATIKCPQLSGNDAKTEGFVTLYDGEPTTVTCTIETPSGNKIYEPILYITLDYLYGEYVDKLVQVKDVSTD